MAGRDSRPWFRSFATCAAAAVGLTASGCVSTGRLAEFDFTDRTIVAVSTDPGDPFVEVAPRNEGDAWYEDIEDESDLEKMPSALSMLLTLAVGVGETVEIDKIEDKLEGAARRIDVAETVAEMALPEAARLLGARVVEDAEGADFEMRIVVERYGYHVAQSWEASEFSMGADAALVHRSSGAVVWRASVEVDGATEYDPLFTGSTLNSALTAMDLSGISEDDARQELESLAAKCAHLLVDRLARSMRKVEKAARSE